MDFHIFSLYEITIIFKGSCTSLSMEKKLDLDEESLSRQTRTNVKLYIKCIHFHILIFLRAQNEKKPF